MNRTLYRLICVLMWVFAAGMVVGFWDELVRTAEDAFPKNGSAVVVVSVVVGSLAVLLAQAKLGDAYVQHGDRDTVRNLSREEIRAEAEKNAEAAIAKGEKSLAMRIYEGSGIYGKALELARELQDKHSLARLYTRMGNHERARRYHVELKNYEGAAQSSALMGEIEIARELYREAALARQQEGLSPAVLAGLWDRAGEWKTAARLYEEDEELEHAAECYDLLGDKQNAKRCAESARMFRAIERRKSGGSGRMDPGKAELKQSAEEREAMGDLFGAGLLYREADQMLEAAIVFEKYQEWERAARAYDTVGLPERAAMARMNIKEVPQEIETEVHPGMTTGHAPVSPPTSAPLPNAVPHSRFTPVTHQSEFVPVHLPESVSGAPVSGEVALKIAQRVRRGNFREAAEYALSANDWLMAAALFEQAGDLVRAADIYRSIGKVNDAMFCLERAERPKEAVLLALASGDEDRSIKMLHEALEKKPDVELSALLAELMINRGEVAQAADIVRRQVTPQGINPQTAPEYFRFGRLMEANGGQKEALEIYRELLSAGALNDQLIEREKELAVALEESAFVMPESTAVTAVIDQPTSAGIVTQTADDNRPGASFELSIGGNGAPLQQEISLFGVPDLALPEFDPDAEPEEDRQPVGPLDPFSGRQRYAIRKEIARGGMGIIYEAEDTALGRDVALKIIQNDSASPEEFQQFILEARSIARLNHPNVVTIYDIGLLNYKHYITMELIRGATLEKHVLESGGLPIREAMRLFIEISRGLQKAHGSGIVHRDIKPTNVLLNEIREVKIVDFGLAKLGASEEDHTGETIFKMSGTPGYMAPETIQGQESLPRADIYAAGITLFFMLMGKAPHVVMGKTKPRQIAQFQLAGTLPKIREHKPDVPGIIDELYQYCTAATPESRYQSVSDYLGVAERWYAAAE